MKKTNKILKSKSGYPIGTLAASFAYKRTAKQNKIEELSELIEQPIEIVSRFANAPMNIRRQAFIDIRQGLLESILEEDRTTRSVDDRRDYIECQYGSGHCGKQIRGSNNPVYVK